MMELNSIHIGLKWKLKLENRNTVEIIFPFCVYCVDECVCVGIPNIYIWSLLYCSPWCSLSNNISTETRDLRNGSLCWESPLSVFATELHVSITLPDVHVSYRDLTSSPQAGMASVLTTEIISQSHKSLFGFRRLVKKTISWRVVKSPMWVIYDCYIKSGISLSGLKLYGAS